MAGGRETQRRAVRKFCPHCAGRAPYRHGEHARACTAAMGGRSARAGGRAGTPAGPEICRVRAGRHQARGRGPRAGPCARRPLCRLLCKTSAGLPAGACGRGGRQRDGGRGISVCPLCPVHCAPGCGRGAAKGKKRAQKGAFQPVGYQARRLCGASKPRHWRLCGHPQAGPAGRCQRLFKKRIRQGRQPVCARDAAGHCQPLYRAGRRRARKAGQAGRRCMGQNQNARAQGHAGNGQRAD